MQPTLAWLREAMAEWPSNDVAAYLCERAVMAYDPWVKASLEGERASHVRVFDRPETLGSKLVMLGSIAIVLAALVWCVNALWFHLSLAEAPWLWRVVAWVAAVLTAVWLLASPTTLRAVGYVQDGRSFLVFRGTVGRTQLLLTDGAVMPWGWPLRHLGFMRSWAVLRPEVTEWLMQVPADANRLVITGHSLGGAMALLAAWELSGARPVEAVVTFGAPRTGLFLFRRAYQSKPSGPGAGAGTLGAVTWRYTQGTDLVSRIPPPLPYCHVGEEFYLRGDGRIKQGRPPFLVERVVAAFEALQLLWKLSPEQRTNLWADPISQFREIRWRLADGWSPDFSPYMVGGSKVIFWTPKRDVGVTPVVKWVSDWVKTPQYMIIGLLSSIPIYGIIYFAVVVLVCVKGRDSFEHECRKYLAAFRTTPRWHWYLHKISEAQVVSGKSVKF